MGLWDGFFTKAAPRQQFEQPASGGTIARVVGNSGYAFMQSADDITRYVVQYERVLMVWRCIDAGATATSRVPLQVRDRAGEKGQVIDSARLNYLLNQKPNTYETAFQFRYRLYTILKLSRKGAFIELVWGDRGTLLEIHILPNEKVTVVGDPRRYIKGYWVDGAEGRRWLSKERVLWIRTKPHPTDVYAQMTPLVAAGLATDTDYLARLFNRNFLANDGRPGMIVGLRGRVSPEDKARLNERYGGGPQRAGETTIINADDLTIADMAGTPRDAQWLEAVSGSKLDIMLAFGTPETALGNASGRTFDNADAEMEQWWLEVNSADLDIHGSAFSDITEDGPAGPMVVVPDYDTVPVMQRAKKDRHDKLMAEFEANVITLNEYRIGTGRDPIGPGGDVFYTAIQQVLIGSVGERVDLKAIADSPIIGNIQPASAQGQVPDPTAAIQDQFANMQRSSNNDQAARALRLVAQGGQLVKADDDIETKADDMELEKVGPQTYHVRHKGKRIGTVGHVNLHGAGKGWMAWDYEGNELDAFEERMHEAVGVVNRHYFRDRLGRFAHKPGTKSETKAKRGYPKTQKCKYCTNQATKRIIHSEGMAYIPVCDDHLARGKRAAAHSVPGGGNDPSNIDYVREVKSDVIHVKAVRMPQSRTSAADEAQGAVKALLDAYGRQVVGRFQGAKLRRDTRYWDPPGTNPMDWDRVVDKLPAQARFREDVQSVIQRIAYRTADEMMVRWGGEADRRTLHLEVDRQVVNPIVGYAVEGFGKFIDTMFRSVTDADIEGARMSDLTDVIDTAVHEKGDSWAENAGKYIAGGAVEGAQGVFATLNSESVDLVKTWHTKDDDKVRPSHWAVDGQTIDATAKFRVGNALMAHPHDPTAPVEENAGCRCHVSYRQRRSGDPFGTQPRPTRRRREETAV